jgi:serine/threonine-protein kinase
VADRYRIERRIGTGGMAVVYLAEDTKVGQRRALKFILPRFLRKESALRRFLKEAKVTLELSHPNIVKVLHLEEWNGSAFLIMEYVAGGTLRDLLADKRKQRALLEWGQIVDILAQVLSALAYSHKKGIIHRDLKPSNVLVERQADGTHGSCLPTSGWLG